jgi:centrin-1
LPAASAAQLSVVPETSRRTTAATASAFSQVELEEMKEAFNLFDTHGTGRIKCGELRTVLESLASAGSSSSSSTYPNLDRLLVALSQRSDEEFLDMNGYLQLMESTSSFQRTLKEGGQEGNFAHVFEIFDVEGKGYITLQDLERIAQELGEHDMTQEELEEMMERANTQNQGRVYLEEFTKLMTLHLFRRPEA